MSRRIPLLTLSPLVARAGAHTDTVGADDVLENDVLEVAARDLSVYEAFDATAYTDARGAFHGVLTAQPGVAREHPWVSVLDPNVVIGMRVYEDAAAFQTAATDPAVATSDEAAVFSGAYPPIAGFAHAVVQ
jgi:hypothetical protein